jgi:hypothetical protein
MRRREWGVPRWFLVVTTIGISIIASGSVFVVTSALVAFFSR